MVRRGEFLERMVVIPSGELSLEGLYHRGDRTPPLLLASPHPRQGGSMDSPVVQEIAWAVTRAGHATLRFNYRGSGASQGAWSGGEGELSDTLAAAAQLEETAGALPAIGGYSFGARMALSAALHRPVRGLLLVAPPTSLFSFEELAQVEVPVLVVLGEEDRQADRGVLEPLLARAPAGRAVVVPGANHFFQRGLPAVGRAAVELLDQCMASA